GGEQAVSAGHLRVVEDAGVEVAAAVLVLRDEIAVRIEEVQEGVEGGALLIDVVTLPGLHRNEIRLDAAQLRVEWIGLRQLVAAVIPAVAIEGDGARRAGLLLVHFENETAHAVVMAVDEDIELAGEVGRVREIEAGLAVTEDLLARADTALENQCRR